MSTSPRRGLIDIRYLLNPSTSIGGGASFKNAFSMYGNVYTGVGVHLAMSYHVGAGSGRANLKIEPSMNPIFPLFYSYYDEHPAGTLTIRNTSPGPVQDISASFFVKEYMEQPKVFYRAPALDRDHGVDVPVQALFERSIFDVTTETKVAGEIAVTYKYLGNDVTDRKAVTITINNRNAMTWDDDRKAAAFVTATDPDIMLFAKGIASDAGSKSIPPAVNANFRIAMTLFQGMALQGVGYVTDPTTPYGSTLGNTQAIDYLQFPVQTLAYRAGDCDDLSILYCALLEAAGIRSAFITVSGHIYAAFELGMRPEDARATFSNPKSLIFRDNETWVPVKITLVRKGFTEAWQEYRPVSSSRVMKDGVKLPDSASVFQAYTAELNRYLGIDLKPRVATFKPGYTSFPMDPDYLSVLRKYGVYPLKDGAYNFYVREHDAAGNVSSWLTSAVTVVPIIPINSATGVNPISVRFQWHPFGAAAAYELHLVDPKGKDFPFGKVSNDYTLTGLTVAIKYLWYVIELKSGAYSPAKGAYYNFTTQ